MSRSPVARYFDEVATSYAARYDDRGPAGHAFAIRWQRVFEQLGRPSGHLLDAGCGPGVFLEGVGGLESGVRGQGPGAGERSTFNVQPSTVGGAEAPGYNLGVQPSAFSLQPFGIDLSPKMAAEAARRAPGARLAVGSLDRLPYRDGMFDWVVAMGAIEYVPDHWEAVGELIRVLRPGGRILATFPNWWSPYRIWKGTVFYPIVNLLRPIVYRLRGRPALATVTAHHHAYHEREIRARFAALNCPIEDLVYLNFQVLTSPLDEWLPGLSVALSQRLEALGRGPLRRIGTAMLISARRSGPDPESSGSRLAGEG